MTPARLGVALGGPLLIGVAMLLTRALRPVLEIRLYVKSISAAAEKLERNLTGVEELERMRRVTAALPGAAADYRRSVGGVAS